MYGNADRPERCCNSLSLADMVTRSDPALGGCSNVLLEWQYQYWRDPGWGHRCCCRDLTVTGQLQAAMECVQPAE